MDEAMKAGYASGYTCGLRDGITLAARMAEEWGRFTVARDLRRLVADVPAARAEAERMEREG